MRWWYWVLIWLVAMIVAWAFMYGATYNDTND